MTTQFEAGATTALPRSQIRHRLINPTRAGSTTVVTPRASRPSRVLGRIHTKPGQGPSQQDQKLIATLTRQSQAPDTEDDEEIAPGVRPDGKIHPSTQRARHQGWPPIIWIGLTLLGMLGFWWLTTAGLAFLVTHASDPGTYGPMHGNIITTVLGGGDSPGQPSKLIAMNNGGRVEIIRLLANDPTKAQLVLGPNLVTAGFPDPANAEISLSATSGAVHVTIYASLYDFPFHRYQARYTFREDGQGNLKPESQQ